MLIDRFPTRRLICVIVVSLLTATITVEAKPHVGPNVVVVDVTVVDDSSLAVLEFLDRQERGMEIWSEVPQPGIVSVRADEAAIAALTEAGFEFAISIPDLQAHINELFVEPGDGDFFDGHRTYDEHVEFLQQLAAQHPEVTDLFSVGTSVLGREMWCLRIGSNMGEVPGVVYHGAQHGNEGVGAAVVAYVANHLLTNYQSDEHIAALVSGVDWFLVPIMNPDGYVSFSRENENGFDLNRNWGGPGANQNPFSQPETAAMRDLFLNHPNIEGHIDFHGHIRWLMWPWGHTSAHTPHHDLFGAVVFGAGERIAATGGGEYDQGTIWDVAYQVRGGSIDYTYGELGVWGFAFEIRNSQVPAMCIEFLEASLHVAHMVRDCLGNGLTTDPELDCNENGNIDLCDFAYGTSLDSNNDGIPNECHAFIASDPADGTIIAQQPTGIHNMPIYGLPTVRFTFPDPIVWADASLFEISTEPAGPPPIIGNVIVDESTISLVFNITGGIPTGVGKWTIITHRPSGAAIRIGYLPGDVNGDRFTSPVDILALIDSLNGVSPRPITSTDIDRSGAATPADILRLIDMLNGASGYAVWNGASLP